MRVSKCILVLLVMIFQLVIPPCSLAAAQAVGPPFATKLIFYNASNADVVVLCSHPALPTSGEQEDGCATGSVSFYRVKDLTAGTAPQPLTMFGNPGLGWFILKRGHQVQFLNVAINPYTGTPNYCLQGTIFGFGQGGAICPDNTNPGGAPTSFPSTKPGPGFDNPVVPPVKLPNGSNGFEATLNLPGTIQGKPVGTPFIPGNQEAVDITCVNGANCTLSVHLIPPPGGPYWSGAVGYGTNRLLRGPFMFQNSWVDIAHQCDNNCIDPATGFARPGVFPYGCTQCNKNPDPDPPCTGPSKNMVAQFCAARNGLPGNNGCQFGRAPQTYKYGKNGPAPLSRPNQKFGGTVICTYLGPLSPPGSCPPGSKSYQ